jgi:hypothetical protein
VDLSKPFVLNIDASDFALGAMLSQPKHDDILYLFSFIVVGFFFLRLIMKFMIKNFHYKKI